MASYIATMSGWDVKGYLSFFFRFFPSLPVGLFTGGSTGLSSSGEVVGAATAWVPGVRNLTYDPFSLTLYTPAELFTSHGGDDGHGLDQRIYEHFVKQGR